MSAFTSHLAISPTFDGRWKLDAPLVWEMGRKGSGLTITVPKGFASDLASIPSPVRWWLNPADARFARAAILHDWFLASRDWSRVTASAEFFEALRAGGVGRFKATAMAIAILVWTLLLHR